MNIGAFILLSLVSTATSAESGKGRLEVEYRPIVCVTTPCPQFLVVSINGEPVSGIGADLVNFSPEGKAMTNFRRVTVKGKWTASADGQYLEVTASSWQATVGEKISTKSKGEKAPEPEPVKPSAGEKP